MSNCHSVQVKNCSKIGIASSSQTLPPGNEEIRRFGGGKGNLGSLSPNPNGLRQTISARGSWKVENEKLAIRSDPELSWDWRSKSVLFVVILRDEYQTGRTLKFKPCAASSLWSASASAVWRPPPAQPSWGLWSAR